MTHKLEVSLDRADNIIEGWRDTLIKLERQKGFVVVKVEPRWAAAVEPFNLEFRDGTVWPTEKSSLSPQAESIRSFLRSQGGQSTKAAVGGHLGIRRNALQKALKRAEEADAIVIDGDEVKLPETEKGSSLDVLALADETK